MNDMKNHLLEKACECDDSYLARHLLKLADKPTVGDIDSAIMFAAADRLGQDVFRGSRSPVRETKGEAAERLYPVGLYGITAYDTALPQTWLDKVHDLMAERMSNAEVVGIDKQGGVAAQFITLYQGSPYPAVVPITRTGVMLQAWLANTLM